MGVCKVLLDSSICEKAILKKGEFKMNSYVTGGTIRSLREKRQLTQKQLGELVMVSDKTVSKWETGFSLN